MLNIIYQNLFFLDYKDKKLAESIDNRVFNHEDLQKRINDPKDRINFKKVILETNPKVRINSQCFLLEHHI
ncbi:unnamed protein product [Paramecium sonneborni]|uniref:Uncharacterized protein n=1 Tax=Paramecium sonneborni TaxID=65129 RepID=A0A8S1QX44_9CILI|nr:unnamed protein product [Paramecium sonneborni]